MLRKVLSVILTISMLITSVLGTSFFTNEKKVKAAEVLSETSMQITSEMDASALIIKYSSAVDGTALLFIDDGKKMEIPIANTEGATLTKEIKILIPKESVARLDFIEGMLVEDMFATDRYEAEYANIFGVDADGNEIEVVEDGGASNGLKVVKIWGNGSYLEFPNVTAGTHLTLGYSCADIGRRISLYINGADTGINIEIDNLSEGWGGINQFREVTFPVDIPDGATIKLQKDDDNTDFQMDYIKVFTVTELDVEVPTAPSDLQFISKTGRAVELSWTASNDNVGVIGYDVFANGKKINSNLIDGTNYIVRGLVPETEYTFTVVAMDAAGNKSKPGSLTLTTELLETGTDVIYEAEYAKLYGLENIHVEPDSGASSKHS